MSIRAPMPSEMIIEPIIHGISFFGIGYLVYIGAFGAWIAVTGCMNN